MRNKKRILVAMSGGVDSSATAALLKKQGHDVVGVTMQLWDYGDSDRGCCTIGDVRDARRVAEHIGIPHYVVNYMDVFKKRIVNDFISKYASGKTPNPCVLCNQFVKFDVLLKRTMEIEADYLATGHYATVKKFDGDGKYYLHKASDLNKDQTYFLFTLAQSELSKLMFPLGEMDKDEVRELAADLGLKVADKPDSQDICFVSGGDYRSFLETHGKIGDNKGEIIDTDGNVVGHHNGVHLFTVGQRKGVGISGSEEKIYVIKVDPDTNRVYVGAREELMRTTLVASDVVWASDPPAESFRAKTRIRHRHKESDTKITLREGGTALVEFEAPQRAMTPGQAVVFYDNDRVLGGGWISEVL